MRIIDIDVAVLILTDQRLTGEKEHIATIRACVAKIGGGAILPGRDEIDTSTGTFAKTFV
jgi:hypothetical protein